MLSSSLYAMIKLSKTTSPYKLFDNDCVMLYIKRKEKAAGQMIDNAGSRGGVNPRYDKCQTIR